MSSILPPPPPKRPASVALAALVQAASAHDPQPAPGLHVTVHLAALRAVLVTLLATVIAAAGTAGVQLVTSGGISFGSGQEAGLITATVLASLTYIIKVANGYRSGGSSS